MDLHIVIAVLLTLARKSVRQFLGRLVFGLFRSTWVRSTVQGGFRGCIRPLLEQGRIRMRQLYRGLNRRWVLLDAGWSSSRQLFARQIEACSVPIQPWCTRTQFLSLTQSPSLRLVMLSWGCTCWWCRYFDTDPLLGTLLVHSHWKLSVLLVHSLRQVVELAWCSLLVLC